MVNKTLNSGHVNKRILIAKLGLDGHDKGAKIIINFLKESGYEVIYSGLHKSPKQVANIAIQEDVVAIGVSILSGSHLELIAELVNELNSMSSRTKIIFVGGTIPSPDINSLLEIGISAVFPTGSKVIEILEWLKHQLYNIG